MRLASCVPMVCPGYAPPHDGGGAVQQLKAQICAAVTVSPPCFDHKTISPIFPPWPPPHMQVVFFFLQQQVWLSGDISKKQDKLHAVSSLRQISMVCGPVAT